METMQPIDDWLGPVWVFGMLWLLWSEWGNKPKRRINKSGRQSPLLCRWLLSLSCQSFPGLSHFFEHHSILFRLG
jgi:hypothetical protein